MVTNKPLGLRWPSWFPPGEDDKQLQAQTVKMLRDAGVMSQETAIAVIASTYDIEDIPSEVARIQANEAAADVRAAAQTAVVTKITEDVEG